MSDLKKMSMSELIARYNALAATKGVEVVTEFKNLAAARAAVTKLEEGPIMTEEAVPAGTEGAVSTSKYSSTGKRGPNQGIGEFSKAQILAGKTNAEILEMIRAQFPEAKTTTNSIAYYRAALKNPNLGKRTGKTAEQLREEAQALLAKAEAAEAAAKAKASAEAEATQAPV